MKYLLITVIFAVNGCKKPAESNTDSIVHKHGDDHYIMFKHETNNESFCITKCSEDPTTYTDKSSLTDICTAKYKLNKKSLDNDLKSKIENNTRDFRVDGHEPGKINEIFPILEKYVKPLPQNSRECNIASYYSSGSVTKNAKTSGAVDSSRTESQDPNGVTGNYVCLGYAESTSFFFGVTLQKDFKKEDHHDPVKAREEWCNGLNQDKSKCSSPGYTGKNSCYKYQEIDRGKFYTKGTASPHNWAYRVNSSCYKGHYWTPVSPVENDGKSRFCHSGEGNILIQQ